MPAPGLRLEACAITFVSAAVGLSVAWLAAVSLSAAPLMAAEVMELSASTPRFPSASVKPTFGFYRDNFGHQRTRSDLSLSFGPVGLTLGQETVRDDEWQQDKYLSSLYGGAERRNRSASLTVAGNLGGTGLASGKLIDLRGMVGGSDDGVVSSKTFGIGASQWLVHETLQLGIDLSANNIKQPEFEILDFDATALTAPETVDSRSATATFRHLTTPTTMTLGSFTVTDRTDRPMTRFYHLGVRQYIPAAQGAVHAAAYRGLNRGTLSTTTLYGEVDSWTGDFAWVQELGEKTQIRIGWRVHQELEIGRAYGDKTQFGSDLYSIGLASDIDPALTLGRSVTVDFGVAHYETNQKLVARGANFGFSGRF